MNERIQELLKQAVIAVDNPFPGNPLNDELEKMYIPDCLAEKFAELIVRECVEQLELVRKYRYDRVQPLENQQTIIDECQYQIKQHFGVEE